MAGYMSQIIDSTNQGEIAPPEGVNEVFYGESDDEDVGPEVADPGIFDQSLFIKVKSQKMQ